jgi:hypothetical protein
MDYTTIIAAVDFTAVLAAMASIATVYGALFIARKGAGVVLSMVKRGS